MGETRRPHKQGKERNFELDFAPPLVAPARFPGLKKTPRPFQKGVLSCFVVFFGKTYMIGIEFFESIRDLWRARRANKSRTLLYFQEKLCDVIDRRRGPHSFYRSTLEEGSALSHCRTMELRAADLLDKEPR